MTSISENEMNIQIPLCNVWYLNGIFKILWIFSEKVAYLKKKFKILGFKQ